MLLERSQSMRGYGRVDEDLDEYEDDVEVEYGDLGEDRYEDEEDEEEEEEEEAIPEEKLKYLDLRQKLKEKCRYKYRKESGANLNNSQDRRVASSLGRFGCFFGPSRPEVADRVILESRAFLETKHLSAEKSTSQNEGKRATASSTSAPKNGVSNKPNIKVISKAQVIKRNRDYSSLLSDDAEIPKPGGDSGHQKNLLSRTDARSAQVPAKINEASSSSRTKVMNGYEQRKPSSGVQQPRHSQTARPLMRTSGSGASRGNLGSSDSKRQLDLRKQPPLSRQTQSSRQPQSSRQLSSSNGSGPVRSAVPKGLPPKKPLSSSDKKTAVGAMERKASIPNGQRSIPVGNKASTVTKNSMSNGQRSVPMKSQTSILSNRLENRRDFQHSSEGKILKKESYQASKFQAARPPRHDPVRSKLGKDQYLKKQKPSGQLNVQRSGSVNKDSYNKKRRADEAFSDEELDYSSVIRGLFRQPRHYEDIDDEEDDDMCMEVGFDAIQREEMRSARIAKKEDDEELLKIMEEERQEKLRKQAKLRKKNQR